MNEVRNQLHGDVADDSDVGLGNQQEVILCRPGFDSRANQLHVPAMRSRQSLIETSKSMDELHERFCV
ncbi:MAG: hypothetical protein M3N32_08340 [Actinomycetota bacterium]|nr:hypothetical protein [Actinomycetota bacterium]